MSKIDFDLVSKYQRSNLVDFSVNTSTIKARIQISRL